MTELLPHQVEGVRQIYRFHGRALLADEQGLGKTIEALEWIRRIPSRRPAVVICPASVKYTWQSEAALHFNMRTEVLEGRNGKGKKLPGDIVILNYDILPYWINTLRAADPKVVILDECQYITNPKAKRTKAVLEFTEAADSVVGLSGTPFTNRPIELWSVLAAIKPDLFPSRQEFAWRYCKPRFYMGRWHYKGATRTDELHRILRKHVMIRRLKKDVLDLPPVTQRAVPFKLDSYEEYNKAQKHFIRWLRSISPARARKAAKSEALTKVGYMIRLAARLKLRWTEQWIRDFLDNNPGEKLVGLTMHTFVIDHLRDAFRGRILWIDGRVTGQKRHDVVRAFQSNRRYTLLAGNWKAAGIGLTLTAACNIAALDEPWTPGDMLQGRDRIHRIGQTRPCTLHHLMLLGTIEEKQIKVLRSKSKVLDAILNGQASEEELNIFDELLEEMRREAR